MKNQEIINKIRESPKFLSEDWIEKAIQKLDKSRMTPEQRMHFVVLLAKNATIIEMEKEERRQEIEEAKKEAAIETARGLKESAVDYEIISKTTGLTIREIEEW